MAKSTTPAARRPVRLRRPSPHILSFDDLYEMARAGLERRHREGSLVFTAEAPPGWPKTPVDAVRRAKVEEMVARFNAPGSTIAGAVPLATSESMRARAIADMFTGWATALDAGLKGRERDYVRTLVNDVWEKVATADEPSVTVLQCIELVVRLRSLVLGLTLPASASPSERRAAEAGLLDAEVVNLRGILAMYLSATRISRLADDTARAALRSWANSSRPKKDDKKPLKWDAAHAVVKELGVAPGIEVESLRRYWVEIVAAQRRNDGRTDSARKPMVAEAIGALLTKPKRRNKPPRR